MYSPLFTHYLSVFSRISLHDLLIFSLKPSILFINVVLKSFSWALAMLEYLGLAVIGWLGSHEHVLPWLLLTMFLNYCLGIWTWVDYSFGIDFWVCLLWVGVLFLVFCFLSRFSETVIVMCCLVCWSALVLCSQGTLAGAGGWDAVMSEEGLLAGSFISKNYYTTSGGR